jgi:FtsH-binding integral membrane protein
MNRAQKRTWLTFAISAATLLISASVIWYAWVNKIDLIDFDRPMRTRLIMLPSTIPLILIVVISMRYKGKDYDERDLLIERRSSGIGYLMAFIFLTVAGYCLFLINPRGSTRNIYVVMCCSFLIYLAAFVWFFVSAIAALILYGKGEKL